jgi:hypothetical protein
MDIAVHEPKGTALLCAMTFLQAALESPDTAVGQTLCTFTKRANPPKVGLAAFSAGFLYAFSLSGDISAIYRCRV